MIEVKIDGARGVLFSVAGGYDMAMSEIQDAAEIITGAVAPDANIIFGASIRPELEDEIVVTVVATGFDSEYYRKLDAERAVEEQRQSYASQTVADVMPESSYESYGGYGGVQNETVRQDTSVVDTQRGMNMGNSAGVSGTADFTAEQRNDMWNSIRTETDDDLDVPPSLRERLRNKGRE